MIKKHKKYSNPKKPFDKPRILDENKFVKKYGLKNKKEIWKTESQVQYFRSRAKSLITAEQDEQKKFFDKLNIIGLNIKGIADVLALDLEALMERRLSSVLVSKKLANTPKQARQMIVHKRVLIGDVVVNVPSYLVKVSEEDFISIRKKVKKPKAEEKPAEEAAPIEEEKVEEVKEDNTGDVKTEESKEETQ